MCKDNVIERCTGCEITWHKDLSKNEKSFFHFFRSVETEKEIQNVVEGKVDQIDLEAEQMEADFDMGCAFRDEAIPMALEHYLGVVSDPMGEGYDEGDEWGDCDDDQEESKEQDCKQQ